MAYPLRIFIAGCCIVFVVFHQTVADCEFPVDLRGEWQTSDLGTLTFNSSRFGTVDVGAFGQGQMIFNCRIQSGTRYVSVSDPFTFLNAQYQLAMCLDLRQVLPTKFVYYIATPVLSNTIGDRLTLQSSGHNFTVSGVCSISEPYDLALHRIMIQTGTIEDSQITCPDDLLGEFSYTIETGSGNSCNKSNMDVCSDLTQMSFDYATCPEEMAYSSEGNVSCVYYNASDSVTYLSVYNLDTNATDETNYFQFTCYAFNKSEENVYVTQFPGGCHEGQSATYVSSPGFSLILSAKYSCVPVITTTTTTTTTTATTTETSTTTETMSTTAVTTPTTVSIATTAKTAGPKVMSAGNITAVVIGVVILLVAWVAFVAWLCIKKCHHKVEQGNDDPEHSTDSFNRLWSASSGVSNGRLSNFAPHLSPAELSNQKLPPPRLPKIENSVSSRLPDPKNGKKRGRKTSKHSTLPEPTKTISPRLPSLEKVKMFPANNDNKGEKFFTVTQETAETLYKDERKLSLLSDVVQESEIPGAVDYHTVDMPLTNDGIFPHSLSPKNDSTSMSPEPLKSPTSFPSHLPSLTNEVVYPIDNDSIGRRFYSETPEIAHDIKECEQKSSLVVLVNQEMDVVNSAQQIPDTIEEIFPHPDIAGNEMSTCIPKTDEEKLHYLLGREQVSEMSAADDDNYSMSYKLEDHEVPMLIKTNDDISPSALQAVYSSMASDIRSLSPEGETHDIIIPDETELRNASISRDDILSDIPEETEYVAQCDSDGDIDGGVTPGRTSRMSFHDTMDIIEDLE